jgi:non-heme chloroperoxidase
MANEMADHTIALPQLIRLCLHAERSPDEMYCFLGYHISVPPYVRQGLLSCHLNRDPMMAQMRKPIWLSYSEQDAIVPLSVGQHIARLAQQAKFSVYPQVGHVLYWEAPKRLNGELREFRASV